jgi:hypothetical protein
MKEFKEYLAESIEIMGDSFEYIQELLEDKNMFSRLMKFERDSVGDLTGIAFDVNDLSPQKREKIIASMHKYGFKNATIEFHDWNKLWLITVERIRIQRKSSANALINSFYFGLTESSSNKEVTKEEKKISMLERILGKKITKKDE